VSDISVVMCTYNGERFVERQLRSILEQTLPPAEVVIGDDGSTDATLDVVDTVAAGSPVPVRVHRNEGRLGFADNFLRACDRAGGRYIAFSDQDDLWAPRKLQTAHRALLAHDAALCVHPVELIDSQGTPLEGGRSKPVPTRVIEPLQPDPWGNFYGFTMLFDRLLLDRIPDDRRGTDPHAQDQVLSHDRWVYFLATTFGRTVVLGECLAAYRQHDAQMYGGEKGRTLRERLATKVSAGQRQARYLATVAAQRAEVLESLAPSGAAGERWRAGAARWRTIESHVRNRARLYEPMTGRARLGVLAANARAGTYGAFDAGGLGPRRLAEDVAVSATICGLHVR
jgi:Glycosyl transferase family 2